MVRNPWLENFHLEIPNHTHLDTPSEDLIVAKRTHFNGSKFKIVKKYQWNLIMIHYVIKNSQKNWLISFKKSQKGDF